MKTNKPNPEKQNIIKPQKPVEQRMGNEILDAAIGIVVVTLMAAGLVWIVGMLI